MVQDILASSGLITFLHQLWCWAIVDVQLLNVILLLLITLTAKHRKGCVSVCSTVLPSATSLVVQVPDQQRPLSNLLSYILRLITKGSLASAGNNTSSNKTQTIESAFDIIQNCVLEIEGRSIVYKSNFFQIFIEHFERVSRDINRYDRRFLDVIINLSFFTDGQTSLLKNARKRKRFSFEVEFREFICRNVCGGYSSCTFIIIFDYTTTISNDFKKFSVFFNT